MFRYIVRRLLQGVLTFFGATFIVYSLMFAGGGDPIQALAGEKPVTAQQRAALTEQFHLNENFFTRYLYFLKDFFTGNLTSYTGRNVFENVGQALSLTGRIALIAITFTIVVGVTLGIVAALRRGGIFDTTSLVLTLVVIGIPSIVLAPLAQYLFGIQWKIFPVNYTFEKPFTSLILPGLVLGALSLATAMRLTRASFFDNLRADYVRTATSKGLTRFRVVGVHVLRNSLIPIITFLGVELGNLMGGAIITEGVFNIPGIGGQLYKAIHLDDGPTVITFVSLLVVIYIVANLVVDLLYAVLDPRIRYE
ncbi:peptide/nickel transport system permease protein/oligopeptide transport system permease protein [Hamadaea flava]|uniref:ABC transporter permease n=1 Tax=Hamadaea flava TaxID=1742688 RepID=A0ABV8LGC1_9ACTN|nr:ABC transporter permease [Hamadaea flava]MCP2326561.1 peptide/nickel transport system permease protein/oligopeptide transport system permease protein [Hamadaea flava]